MFKIKLDTKLVQKKEPSIDGEGQAVPNNGNAAKGESSQAAPITNMGQSSLAPPGALPKLKLKTPTGLMPAVTNPVFAPKSKPAGPKVNKSQKRPVGPLTQPTLAGPGMPSINPPKKLKLAGSMGPPPAIKLKTIGSLKLAGASFGSAPSLASHIPAAATLPPLPPPGPPGPKRRGRKPKSDPDSAYQRQLRENMTDEVTYKIASPPPRPHSLRHSVSQTVVGGMEHDITGVGPEGSVSPMQIDFYRGPPESFPPPKFPSSPPTKEELTRLIAKVTEKDTNAIFHLPVTEEMAPGYSEIIKEPMDLTTMRQKLHDGAYQDWPEFWADLDLMFTNALTYNQPPDQVHNYTIRLRKTVAIMVTRIRTNTNNAGGTAIAKRNAAAKKAAQAKAERDAAAKQARAEQRAAQEAKVLKKAGVVDDADDLEIRGTFKTTSVNPAIAVWGGLYGGSSAQGVVYGYGKLTLRPSNPVPSARLYAQSLMRFASGLVGKAKELVMDRVRKAQHASDHVVPAKDESSTSGRGRKKKQQSAPGAAPGGAPAPGAAPALGVLPPPPTLTGLQPAMPPVPAPLMAQPVVHSHAMAVAQGAQMLAHQTQAHVGGLPQNYPASISGVSFAARPPMPGQIMQVQSLAPTSTGLHFATMVMQPPPGPPK